MTDEPRYRITGIYVMPEGPYTVEEPLPLANTNDLVKPRWSAIKVWATNGLVGENLFPMSE